MPAPSTTEMCVVPGIRAGRARAYASATRGLVVEARLAASARSSRMRWTTPPPCDGVERAPRGRGRRGRAASRSSTRTRARSSAYSGRSSATIAAPASRTRSSVATASRCDARPDRRRCGGRPRRAGGSPRGSGGGTPAPRRRRRRRARARSPARRARGHGTRREAPVRVLEARQEPGHGDRASPTWNTCVEASPKSMTSSSISPSPARDAEEAVEDVGVTVDVDEEEAAAGRAGQRPLGDEGGERGRDAGVDGVAALLEYAAPASAVSG